MYMKDEKIVEIDDYRLELENRIRNLLWTISGDYTLNMKVDVPLYLRAKAIALYDGIKQGGLAKGEHHWYGSRNLSKPDYAERNNQISREDMEELARAIEDINARVGEGVTPTEERFAPVEERYPGYYLAEAEAKYIEQFRDWVIHIKLYRKDTEAGKLEKKRRAAEVREIKNRRARFGAR